MTVQASHEVAEHSQQPVSAQRIPADDEDEVGVIVKGILDAIGTTLDIDEEAIEAFESVAFDIVARVSAKCKRVKDINDDEVKNAVQGILVGQLQRTVDNNMQNGIKVACGAKLPVWPELSEMMSKKNHGAVIRASAIAALDLAIYSIVAEILRTACTLDGVGPTIHHKDILDAIHADEDLAAFSSGQTCRYE
jgi:hypothetical protein